MRRGFKIMSLFIPFILTASLNNHRSKTFHFTTRVTFLFVIVVVLLLSSCTRLPNPLQSTELHEETSDALEQIANPPVITPREIDLYTAIALAVKNNRDLRVKIMEAALANQQVDLVRFGMLPKLAANAGYEQTDKYSPSTSVTVTGGEAAAIGDSPTYSTSTEKKISKADLGFTWNALDFGLSYIRAGQNADRYLIAKEIERKAIHNITRDVIIAYWNAVSANQILNDMTPVLERIDVALQNSVYIESLLLDSPLEALKYQRTLLDIQFRLQNQRDELLDAPVQLGKLMGLLPKEEYNLVITDTPLRPTKMNLIVMEKNALAYRPEMRENLYQQRISVEDTKGSMLALIPGLQFNTTWTYSNNQYLLNSNNVNYGARIGANLLDVFSVSSIKKASLAREDIVAKQRLALAMTILSQVHLANIHYAQSLDAFTTLENYYEVNVRIRDQYRRGKTLEKYGELEIIREEANTLLAMMRKDNAYADLQHSIGRIYASVGLDLVPQDVHMIDLLDLAKTIKNNFNTWGEKNVE